MKRRALIAGIAASGASVLVGRRLRRRTRPVPLMTPRGARSLVEEALGRRPERRRLTLDFAPATVTRWDLLIDGASFFPSLLADMRSATSHIHILIFGFKGGEIGDEFRDVLVEKVREGVAARVITEAAFSQPGLGSKAFYDTLVAGGVQVVANQGAFLDLDGLLQDRHIDWRFDDFGHFDHRKVVIVDGLVAYVGGPGIEDHYATGTHDLMLRLEGPVVAQMQAIFLLSWHLQGGPMPSTPAAMDSCFPETADGAGFAAQILHNNPGESHLPIRSAFQQAVADAQRRLYVISPYLSDGPILRGLIDAARRGVDVHVIVPANPHSLPASASVRHWFQRLHDAGVDVREHPQMAHAKVLLSDDVVLAGTANLDALSLRQNWELQLRIEDAAVADRFVRELFDRDLEITTPARMPSGLRERAINAVMSAISPIL